MINIVIDMSYGLTVRAIILLEPRVLVEVDTEGRTPSAYAYHLRRNEICEMLLQCSETDIEWSDVFWLLFFVSSRKPIYSHMADTVELFLFYLLLINCYLVNLFYFSYLHVLCLCFLLIFVGAGSGIYSDVMITYGSYGTRVQCARSTVIVIFYRVFDNSYFL